VTLAGLKVLFTGSGCTRLYIKRLAENDNSKNQVYFGPGFGALNLFPTEEVSPDGRPGNRTFKAKLRFGWLLESGQVSSAPKAQMILYPQYPEVRFSGFLQGCTNAPSKLMTGRQAGRVLFLGITTGGEVVGYVAAADSPAVRELTNERGATAVGVFIKLVLLRGDDEVTSRAKVLSALRHISKAGWIESRQLNKDGTFAPCNAPQCGGFTLEAELGISKNSAAEPDYFGWEIKQHNVSSFDRPASGSPITLMTPEPSGGFYKEQGPEAFVREFGYLDRSGRLERMNFGGVHKIDTKHASTGLTLILQGYDSAADEITNPNGALALVDVGGRIAASWGFAALLSHWSKKHARAVYVPSKRRIEPVRQYSYGSRIRMAERTDSLRLLRAIARGSVFYDPGIKLENMTTSPRVKRRSQFRIASRSIAELYEKLTVIDVFKDG